MFTPIIRRFSTSKQSVVIIGSGWGGFKVLQNLDPTKYDITVVSPRNHFVFTPLLASTAVGTLEFRCIAEPVRHKKRSAKYFEAYARKIDIEKKVLHCENALKKGDFSLKYDKLIIACGAISNTFGTPGVYENAFFLKEVADARNIRHRVIDNFELAAEPDTPEEDKKALLHFAVVGGGPTGIELSAELHDFIEHDVSKLYPHLKPYTKITVFDVAEKILGSFDARLGAYATKKFKRDGIQLRTGTKIQEVKENKLILADQSEVPVGMVVWATGLTENPFIKSLPFVKDKSKRLMTDQFLRVRLESFETVKDIYALGDCANIENYNLPQTAQVANQKANYLAKEMNKAADLPKPFTYYHKGAMAYVGDWRALVDTPTKIKGGGITAWLFWRSSYFTMTVSWKNKVLIPAYWFLTWLSGRDISRF